MDHTIKAHSPLGAETLRFRAMQGTEALSTLFEFEVDLMADRQSLALKSLLGQPLTLEIETRDGGVRYLDGLVTRALLVGLESGLGGDTSDAHPYRYRAVVRPWLWVLTQTRNCKIFQNQSVPEIIAEVLAPYGYPVAQRLTASYRNWTYCVQYQESDFDFVSRLMEHEGIYYYFEHAMGSHTLVLADDMSAHTTLPGYASIAFFESERVATSDQEVIDVYQVAEELAPGAYVTDDYNFTTPSASLKNQRANAASHPHGDMEIYEWMGGYGEAGESDHYSRIRLEALQAARERDEGHAWTCGMAPGYRFTLRNSPRDAANREYLLVSVTYRLRDAAYASSTVKREASYECDFVTQPTSLPFRPARVTPRPHTHGPQTAVVVGPPGEVIWTDEYGRVKVQFRWDRIGTNDENSSCWVRVASNAAGSGMGQLNIPRIGQEVVVDFIGGQPDRPIIMACTYNADMMTAFGLPDLASRSGFVSRTFHGGPSQANHLFFDDLLDAEELALHAEKNYSNTIENDKTNTVGNDQFETIGRDASQEVGATKTTRIGQHYQHAVGATSARTVDSSSREVHHSDYTHTTVGPSFQVRQAPHVQRYGATYNHHVTGEADSIYVAPHVHLHADDFSHHVDADHDHYVGAQYQHKVAGRHVQIVRGDFGHAVDGDHNSGISGDHVHTVGAIHTLTAMGDSHHSTTGTHTLLASEINIGGSGGGGGLGDQFTYEAKAGGNTVTNQISVKSARFTAVAGLQIDATVMKFAATVFNLGIDLAKVSMSVPSFALNRVEIKTYGLKTEKMAYAVRVGPAAIENVKKLSAHAHFFGVIGVLKWRK